MTRIRLGTRGSDLAMAQAEWAARRLTDPADGVAVELVEIRTSGDRMRDVPLGPHLGRSFFTKEIEDALLDGRIDVAVHSCKDLATAPVPGLRLAAVPAREDPRDALVSAAGGLDRLPEGARVGTGSPRRRGFLEAARPDLRVEALRGNVPTRVRAVEEGKLDAVVLAVAGLRRLGLAGRITEVLEADVMLPAASQGALALQVREEDEAAGRIVAGIEDPTARAGVTAERACLRTLQAGCQAPVGALARIEEASLRLEVAVLAPDGIVRTTRAGALSGAEDVGVAAAREVLKRLGVESLQDVPWAGPPPARDPRSPASGGP